MKSTKSALNHLPFLILLSFISIMGALLLNICIWQEALAVHFLLTSNIDFGYYGISLKIDRNDYPHISYCATHSSERVKYASWNGTAWYIEYVDPAPYAGRYSSLALDSNDYPHISYYDQLNGDLKYASWNGTAWYIETVDTVGDVGLNTSLALDRNDYPHISYVRYFDGGYKDLKYASWNGTAWSIETVPTTEGVGWFNSLALDSNDLPYISYWAASYGDPLCLVHWNGTSWQTVTVFSSGIIGYNSLVLDSHDYPHISFTDSWEGCLKYASWNGSNWGFECVDNIGVSYNYNSLALDSDGYPHISYRADEISGYCLKYARWNGSAWYIENVTAPGIEVCFTSLALDGNNYPHIAYSNFTNGGTLCYARWSDVIAPVVTSVGATDINTTAAILHGDLTVLGTAASCNVTFQWGTTSGTYPNETTAQAKNTIGAFSANLTGLNPDTTYYFRAKAVGDGTSYGDEKSFTTGITPPSVSTNPANGITTTSAILNGNLTSLGTADNVTVSFQWRGSSDNYTDETPLEVKSSIGTFGFNLTGLNTSTTYHFRARAVGDGASYGDDRSFTTAGASYPVETVTGTGIVSLSSDAGNITTLAAVAEETLPTAGKPVGVTFPHGLFSFNITNITPGSCVIVTITLPSAVPVGTTYWKYHASEGGWIQIPMGSDDGDNVITITLCDGGLGDDDGLPNGTIVDPGGPATPTPAPASAPSSPGTRASPTPPRPLNPAQMSAQYLSISPQQASANQPVTITTNVVNTGGEAGNYNLVLKINGQVEQTKMVSVGPQGTQPVKFTVAIAQPGTYTVDIAGQKGSFTILGAGGSSAATPASGGIIAMLVVGVLVIVVSTLLILDFRRRA